MRIILLSAAAFALPFAAPVAAKSLHETHELVWSQAGKTPALHYRMADRQPVCDRSLAGPVSSKGLHVAQPADARCAVARADQHKAGDARGR